MKRILGISAFYHDSAAALVVGDLVAAAQEERFSRIKHDSDFPARAVEWCLQEGEVEIEELDYVAFYDKPLLKFDRLLETYLAFVPAGLNSFLASMPGWLKSKLHLPREIRRALKGRFKKGILFTHHHESHAASAFFPSPFERAAVLTIDGVGEWDTSTIAVGEGNRLKLLKSLHFPHSLGLLYSAFTYYTGFRVNSGEYKLMGLAPYGRPEYADLIRQKLIHLGDDGSFAMDMRYFNYCQGLTMTSAAFHQLFGRGPRRPDEFISQLDMDLAASVQEVTEEIMLRMARHVRQLTAQKHLCLAGGVALNCVANGRLLREGLFDDIWIQPASGDAGGAVGAALLVNHQLLDHPRNLSGGDGMKGSLLGPRFSNDEVRASLDRDGAVYTFLEREEDVLHKTAEAIAEGKIVGWFAGRMEFGPRALGSRSILGDPRNTTMQSTLNLRIKFRESFRPFAPSVLAEDVSRYFDLDCESPYMLLVAPVREELRRPLNEAERTAMRAPDLRTRVNVPRSTIPAVTHVDMSARVQTVDERRHGRYYRLLREFKHQTGCSVVVNTSFNVRGEPIVGSPADAFRCFMATDMDVLVVENFILNKAEQRGSSDAERARYLESFQLD